MPRPQQLLATQTVHLGRIRRATGQYLYVLLLSAVTVLSGLLLYIWPQVRLVEMRYVHSTLRERRLKVLQRQKELHVELAALQRLPRIEDIALLRIGLRFPLASQVVYIRGQQMVTSRRER